MKKSRLFLLPIFAMSIGALTGCDAADQIASMATDIQSQITDMQSDIEALKSQVADLKKQIADLENEMNTSIAEVEADYTEKITAIENNIAQMQEEIAALTAKLEADKKALEDDYNEKIGNLKTTHDSDIAALDAKNETALAGLRTNYDAELARIEADYQAQIAALEENYDAELAAITSDYKDRIATLKSKFESDLAELEENYDRELARLRDNYDAELASMVQDYNTKLNSFQTTYQTTVAQIQGNIDAERILINALESEMNLQIVAIQNEFGSKINDLTGRVATLEQVRTHTVTFNTNGGSSIDPVVVIHGEKVSKPVAPTRPGYTFQGWTYLGEPWVFQGYVVTEDMTINANWEYIDYTVTFKNDDGTILETREGIHYGNSVIYHGETPVKPNPVDHYIYTFAGWDVDITNITGNTVAVAQYNATYAPYTVKFVDENDDVLYQTFVEEGQSAVYVGDTPTKEDNDELDLQYQFAKWDEVSRTSDTIVYKTNFASCTKGLIFENNKVYQYDGTAVNVTVPAYWNGYNITEISERAFEDTDVESVVISEGIQTIGFAAFQECTSLTNIEIPSTVTSVGHAFLANCSALESVVLPEGLTYLGRCFQGCTSLVNVNVPEGVLELDRSTFEHCHSLRSIILPDSLKYIKDYVFYDCPLLESINFPEGLLQIDHCSFDGCHSLTSVFIPESVEILGEWTFGDCPLLTIYTAVEKRPKDWVYNFNGNNATVVWGYEKTVVIDDLTYALSIIKNEKYATLIGFNDNVTELAIPNKINGYQVNNIDFRKFYDNRKITSITIPEAITVIPERAFNGCINLKTVTLSGNVTSIENQAFYACRSLESINLPNGLTKIGNEAFFDCTSLENLIIPNSVTELGYRAFHNCDSLTTASIPGSIETLNDGVFEECDLIDNLVIPEGVKTIKRTAFFNSPSLKTLYLPKSVELIEEEAFGYCWNIQKTFYAGSQEVFSHIVIGPNGNNCFTTKPIYYYSESEPQEAGNYWHYVEGVATIW